MSASANAFQSPLRRNVVAALFGCTVGLLIGNLAWAAASRVHQQKTDHPYGLLLNLGLTVFLTANWFRVEGGPSRKEGVLFLGVALGSFALTCLPFAFGVSWNR